MGYVDRVGNEQAETTRHVATVRAISRFKHEESERVRGRHSCRWMLSFRISANAWSGTKAHNATRLGATSSHTCCRLTPCRVGIDAEDP